MFVDQRQRAVQEFLAAHRDDLARQGSVVTSWRRRGDCRVGPYFRLTCRNPNGRQRSIYLGRASELVRSVREALSLLQAPLRDERKMRATRRHLKNAAASARKEFHHELQNVGLLGKGSEVRGWSTISTTALTPTNTRSTTS